MNTTVQCIILFYSCVQCCKVLYTVVQYSIVYIAVQYSIVYTVQYVVVGVQCTLQTFTPTNQLLGEWPQLLAAPISGYLVDKLKGIHFTTLST